MPMEDPGFLALAVRASNMAGLVAGMFSLLLLIKSMLDYSQTGPQLRQEVLANYRGYLVFSLGRLTLASFLLALFLALPGVVVYLVGLVLLGGAYQDPAALLAAAASLGVLTLARFCKVLHDSPGVIVASSHYSMAHFYPLWAKLSPSRLRMAGLLLAGAYGVWLSLGALALYREGAGYAALVLMLLHGLVLCALKCPLSDREPRPVAARRRTGSPNILMLGSDTLRADRLGAAGYRRALTPNLDRLVARGALFGQCYVPCARTAPSLLSLMTGTWPHRHGIRDNFVADSETGLNVPALPRLLADAGYHTVALGDWAAADLGKFDLGFQELEVPDDQWNLKFFLRQGPKDLRLFLSLFVDNAPGRFFLEEIHFLAGVPKTRRIGRRARQLLSRLASEERPFLLNVFMASTHPPFASEHPYYTLFADPAYIGPSKFAMARLTDPFEIIRRQGEPRAEFDLDQILDLYDGCVKSFDDEAGRILDYLDRCGLTSNTLVVVYSDHGMEFFEHETWGQGNSAIGEQSARVPLILAGPQLSSAQSLDAVTRTVDVAPTLLDLLGLPIPPEMEGVSLAPALRGELPPPELPAFHETGIWLTEVPGMPQGHLRYPNLLDLLEIPDTASSTLAIKPEFQKRIIAAKDRMIREGAWKLVYQPLETGCLLKLFDLERDPHCARDVAGEHPDVTARLWERLEEWMRADPYSGDPGRNGTRGS
ncbi:MAG: sulfatase [Thiobacillaceae bacterium]|nr:sulfatase [Thiobacillaceae bacterium]